MSGVPPQLAPLLQRLCDETRPSARSTADNKRHLWKLASTAHALVPKLILCGNNGVPLAHLVEQQVPLALAAAAKRLLADFGMLHSSTLAHDPACVLGDGSLATCGKAVWDLGAVLLSYRRFHGRHAFATDEVASINAQLAESELLPVLAESLTMCAAALLQRDGDAALAAWLTPAHRSSWRPMLCGMLVWTQLAMAAHLCGGGLLASEVGAPLLLRGARVLVAATLLEGQQLCEGRAVLRPDPAAVCWQDEALYCFPLCCAFARYVFVARRQAKAASHSFLEHLCRDPSPYVHVLLYALLFTSCAILRDGTVSAAAAAAVGVGGEEGRQEQLLTLLGGSRGVGRVADDLDFPEELVTCVFLSAAPRGGLPGGYVHDASMLPQLVLEFGSVLTHNVIDAAGVTARLPLEAMVSLPNMLIGSAAAVFDGRSVSCYQCAYHAFAIARSVKELCTACGVMRGELSLAQQLTAATHVLARIAAPGSSDAGGGEAAGPLLRMKCAASALEYIARASNTVIDADVTGAWRGVALDLCASSEGVLRRSNLGAAGAGYDNYEQAVKAEEAVSRLAWIVSGGTEDGRLGPTALVTAMQAAGAHGPEQQALFSLLVAVGKLLPRMRRLAIVDVFASGHVLAEVYVGTTASNMGDRSSGGSGSGSTQHALEALEHVPWLVLYAQLLQQACSVLEALLSGRVDDGPAAAIKRCQALLLATRKATHLLVGHGLCTTAQARGASRSQLAIQQAAADAVAAATDALASARPGADARAAGRAAAPAAAAAAWRRSSDVVDALQELDQALKVQLLPAMSHAEVLLCNAVSATAASSLAAGTAEVAGQLGAGDAATLAPIAAAAGDTVQVLRALQACPALLSLPAQLRAFAGRLSALHPHRFACNNPGCTNLDGASELELVGSKRNQCAGCRTARYCSEACQAAHWPHHKPVCRRLKREAAGMADVMQRRSGL